MNWRIWVMIILELFFITLTILWWNQLNLLNRYFGIGVIIWMTSKIVFHRDFLSQSTGSTKKNG